MKPQPSSTFPGGFRNEGVGDQAATFGSPFQPRNTFDNLVEGASNRVAVAAGRTLAEGGNRTAAFNPLFIHGAVGLGKTHLLQAIANTARQQREKCRVVYLTAEYFMWRFASALRDKQALSLKDNLRDIDLLIIDDMQFLQGNALQNELGHLINRLLDDGQQIVVAADRPPSELGNLLECVRSRLQRGLTLEIERPDSEMRLEMLKRRLHSLQADGFGHELDDGILPHIAQIIDGNGRDLEGALNQILLFSSVEPHLTADRIDEILGHLIRGTETTRIDINEILRVVAHHYKVSKHELTTSSRKRAVIRPRQVAIYLARTLTTTALTTIGRRFGGRDHSTVLHAVNKIEELATTDPGLARDLKRLERLLKEPAA